MKNSRVRRQDETRRQLQETQCAGCAEVAKCRAFLSCRVVGSVACRKGLQSSVVERPLRGRGLVCAS